MSSSVDAFERLNSARPSNSLAFPLLLSAKSSRRLLKDSARKIDTPYYLRKLILNFVTLSVRTSLLQVNHFKKNKKNDKLINKNT